FDQRRSTDRIEAIFRNNSITCASSSIESLPIPRFFSFWLMNFGSPGDKKRPSRFSSAPKRALPIRQGSTFSCNQDKLTHRSVHRVYLGLRFTFRGHRIESQTKALFIMLLLTCSGLVRGFDEGPLFQNIGFELYGGERVGLVGPNGVGKTTLLRLLAGL